MTVPSTPPSPPVKAVPPISTAAITVSSRSGRPAATPPVRRPTWTTAREAGREARRSRRRDQDARSTLMPFSRAASGFEPTAKSERPNAV